MSSSLRLGNFQLSFPESFEEMPENERGGILILQKLLQGLDAEDRAVIMPNTLDDAWNDFRIVESTSTAWSIPQDPRDLVRPGGSLSASLAFLLHYPNFATNERFDGSTYDESSPTIQRMMGSGFNSQNVFWFEFFCRRRKIWATKGERFRPLKHIDMAIMNIYLDWNRLVRSTICTMVLVVFGKENETFFRLLWKDRLHEINLWDGTTFWLLFPENEPSRVRIERIVFFVWHPEFLNRSKNPARGALFDKQLTVIAQMAGITQTFEQQRFHETTSQLELEKYVPDSRTRQEKLAILHRVAYGKANLGLVRQKNTQVEVHCDVCGFERRDVAPYFFTLEGTKFYGVAKASCPVCEEVSDEPLEDRRPGPPRGKNSYYFLPMDPEIPWVLANQQWLGKGKSLYELDAHWREVNARLLDDPATCYGRTAKLLSGKFEPTGETPSGTTDRREAMVLSEDLILFTEDPLDQPDQPIPMMIAGSEVYIRRNNRRV